MAKKPEKKKEKKPAPKKPKKAASEKENFRGIVRIAGKDVGGELTLKRSLLRVRGIGHTLAQSASAIIAKELSIDPSKPVGELDDAQIEKLDKILFNLQDHDMPKFLLNRNGDFRAGTDRHVIMNDLIFEISQDIDREKKQYSWKGYRHAYGQKVRGQKTRNTGRKGMAVGVLRKAVIAAQGGAKAGAKPGAKPAAGAKEKK